MILICGASSGVGPIPAKQSTPGLAEQAWIGHRRGQAGGADEAHAGDGGQSLTALVPAMPDQEASVECLDLPDERMELLDQKHHTVLGHVRQHCAVCLPDSRGEIAAAARTLRRDQFKFRTMTADRVDQHSALAHQQFVRAVQDKHRLPFRALGRHEAHGRAPHRLADRLGIGGVVLLAP